MRRERRRAGVFLVRMELPGPCIGGVASLRVGVKNGVAPKWFARSIHRKDKNLRSILWWLNFDPYTNVELNGAVTHETESAKTHHLNINMMNHKIGTPNCPLETKTKTSVSAWDRSQISNILPMGRKMPKSMKTDIQGGFPQRIYPDLIVAQMAVAEKKGIPKYAA